MNRTTYRSALLLVAGAACGIAQAQPFTITGSGATLQSSLFRNAPISNDFVDLDNDNLSGIDNTAFPDQLARNSPADLPLNVGGVVTFGTNQYFLLHYRETGSGNGIRELLNLGVAFGFDFEVDNFDTDGDTFTNDDFGNSDFVSDDAVYNRLILVDEATGLAGFGNSNNRSGVPYRTIPGTYAADPDVVEAGDLPYNVSGFQFDFSASDVPLAWFLQTPVSIRSTQPSPLRTPGSEGYGLNTLGGAVNQDGTDAGQTNDLQTLPAGVDVNTAMPTPDQTVFDTAIALVPVAAIVNPGVNLTQIEMSDLRTLNATGRRANGENLVCCTRDVGSGTRNAFMNGIGLDPSWGRGENIGPRATSSTTDRVGPLFQASNRGGSSRMEGVVQNNRLATGHTGAERGISRGWLLDNDFELLAVRADIKGGTDFVRPNLEAVLDGGANGYSITGPAAVSTFGDPLAVPATLGGYGFDAGDVDPGTPAPANEAVGAFFANTIRSIQFFVNDPDAVENDFQSGDFLARQFLLPQAAMTTPEINPSSDTQPIPLVANPQFVQDVSDFTADSPTQTFANAAFDSYNFSNTGRVPARTDLSAPATYSDGTMGENYIDQDGNDVTEGTILSARNRVAFDFNGDGLRNASDAADMMAAYNERFGDNTPWVAPNGAGAALNPDGVAPNEFTPADVAGGLAVIEILGDANGDGNFDSADVLYWADGLVLVSDVLDRRAGYAAVDAAWAAFDTDGTPGFFNTTLATGAAYVNGDSLADVSKDGHLPTPGWELNGADGVVDCFDIAYVEANFGDWSDLEQAVAMDLSCDMNADLVVDADDVEYIVVTVLKTTLGDVDLDGDVDDDDAAIIQNGIDNTLTGYCNGDVDLDGDIDADDLAVVSPCIPDLDPPGGDGALGFFDLVAYLTLFAAMDPAADLDPAGGDGQFGFFDLVAYLTLFAAGCP